MFDFNKMNSKFFKKEYNSMFEIMSDIPYLERQESLVFETIKNISNLEGEGVFLRNIKDDIYLKSVSTILRVVNYIDSYTKNIHTNLQISMDNETKTPQLRVVILFDEKGTMQLKTVPTKSIITYTYAEKSIEGGIISSEGHITITKYNKNTKDALDLIFGFGKNDRE